MRFAPVAADPVERRLFVAPGRAHEGERRENVERIVPAAKEKIRFREKRHEASRFPAHEFVALEAVVALALGLIFSERQVAFAQKARHAVVAAREHAHARRAENALLGRAVARHRAVPVDVVFRNVQKRRAVKRKRGRRLELKAREFEHPGVRKRPFVGRALKGRQGVESDVPRRDGGESRSLEHFGREDRRGRLSVRAGDADHLGAVPPALAERREKPCEKFDFPDHGNAADTGARHHGRGRAEVGRESRGEDEHVALVTEFGRKAPRHEAGPGEFGAKRRERGGRLARVGHGEKRPFAREMARGGDARSAHSQNHGPAARPKIGELRHDALLSGSSEWKVR